MSILFRISLIAIFYFLAGCSSKDVNSNPEKSNVAQVDEENQNSEIFTSSGNKKLSDYENSLKFYDQELSKLDKKIEVLELQKTENQAKQKIFQTQLDDKNIQVQENSDDLQTVQERFDYLKKQRQHLEVSFAYSLFNTKYVKNEEESSKYRYYQMSYNAELRDYFQDSDFYMKYGYSYSLLNRDDFETLTNRIRISDRNENLANINALSVALGYHYGIIGFDLKAQLNLSTFSETENMSYSEEDLSHNKSYGFDSNLYGNLYLYLGDKFYISYGMFYSTLFEDVGQTIHFGFLLY